MTIGRLYNLLRKANLVDRFDIHYLGWATRRGYIWYELTIEQSRPFLRTIKELPGINEGSWRQFQKAINKLIVTAVSQGYCELPQGWSIRVNRRGRAYLTYPGYNENSLIALNAAHLTDHSTWSGVGKVRARVLDRLRCTTMAKDQLRVLEEEIKSLSPEETMRRDLAWRRAKSAQQVLYRCLRETRNLI